MTQVRAVVFDMDGVLIDAREWHYEALNRALGLFGYAISRFDHISTYDGLPTSRKLEMISLERGLPRELHSLLNQLKQLYTMELIQSKCKPVFQHEYCLAQLSAAGYKIGVASNSVRRSVEVMMERANLARYLDLIVSNEDVVNAKPDPEIYRVAMERLGVTPDETVVVEDNEHGVRSAQAAGTHVKVVGDPSEVSWTSVSSFIGTVEARVA